MNPSRSDLNSRPDSRHSARITPNVSAALFSSILVVSLLSGCSDSPDLVSISGTVTYEGNPVTSGVVMFQPSNGPPARGTIQSDGSYELSIPDVGEGARIGPNRVRISSREKVEGNSMALGKLLIPERYTKFTTSGLTVEVKPEGNGPFDFNLTE